MNLDSIRVHHLPPGNQQMEQDRALPVVVRDHPKTGGAKPLISYRVIVELSADDDETGLTVRRELDDKTYPKGISCRTSK